MKTYLDDPVLNLTASALRAIRWFILFFLAVAALATLAFIVAAFIPGSQLIDPGKEYVAVLLPTGGVAFFLMARFIKLLRELVLSVRDGQPLSSLNAARLRSMGWLTLGVQALMLIAGVAVGWLNDVSMFDFDGANDLVETLIIAAVLFILARVFEQGARMQEELEGTV